MHRILPLWPCDAPYTEHSPDRFQPSVKEFRVEGSRGAVIVCPGGAYTQKCDYEGDPICEMLNEAGISAYTLDYRVSPCHILAPLEDVRRAIRLVRSLGYKKVGILGFSAGGHLACCAATQYDPGDPTSEDPIERLSSRPDAFVPCYAVTSLVRDPDLIRYIPMLDGYHDDQEILHMLSPEENITADTPPAFIWHTAADRLVSVRHSLLLADAMAQKQIPFELVVFPEGRHGLALSGEVPEVNHWAEMCQNWLIGLEFASQKNPCPKSAGTILHSKEGIFISYTNEQLQKWNHFIDILSNQLPMVVFRTWFAPMELSAVTENEIIVHYGTPDQLDFLTTRYSGLLTRAANHAFGEKYSLKFDCSASSTSSEQ